MEALLKVNDISMVFGGLRAVSNFSMEIKAGELIGLIGPNGAGKTTAFNMITGVYTPTEGEIMFNGTRTSGKKSYQVTQLGMARTFQNIRLNPQETKELMEMIRWIRDKFSLSILLIEHDMGLVMGVCERIYVLEYGFCIASGTPDEIKNNKRVIEAYLGEEVS